MTPSLQTQIAQLAEFDEKRSRPLVREIYRSVFNGDPPFKEEVEQGLRCMEMESARLKPLLLCLSDCVSALDKIHDLESHPGSQADRASLIAEEALQRLSEVLAGLR